MKWRYFDLFIGRKQKKMLMMNKKKISYDHLHEISREAIPCDARIFDDLLRIAKNSDSFLAFSLKCQHLKGQFLERMWSSFLFQMKKYITTQSY